MTRPPVDFSASFLDLLLSAVGGVALLVILFAATLTLSSDARGRPIEGYLIVEVLEPTGIDLLVGHEIRVMVGNGIDSATMFTDLSTPDFRVRWQRTPSRKYRFGVGVPAGTSVSVTLWLARTNSVSGGSESARAAALLPVLKGKANPKFRVYWMRDESEKDSKSVLVTLQPSKSWLEQVELPQ